MSATAAVDAWWDATRERRFLLQRCSACGTVQHHPRLLCTGCGATGDVLGWAEASGDATVHAVTVVHRAGADHVTAPYAVALVDLAEGPRLLTWVVDVDPDQVRCDQPVRLAWRPHPDDGDGERPRHLPVFVPAAADGDR